MREMVDLFGVFWFVIDADSEGYEGLFFFWIK